MKWLMRLYPRWWRERYAEELEALLQQRPLRLRDLPDIARSALDARLTGRAGRSWRMHEAALYVKGEQAMKVKSTVAGICIGVAVASLVLAAAVAHFWPTAGSGAMPAVGLYTLDRSHGVRLLPVDAPGLTSFRHGRVIRVGALQTHMPRPQVLQSDDGRTIAAMSLVSTDGPFTGELESTCETGGCIEQAWTFNVATGTRRASFRLPLGVVVQGLSRDGTRLLGTQLRQVHTRVAWRVKDTWYAFSTMTGQVVSRLRLPSTAMLTACTNGQCTPLTLYDPVRGRLYLLAMHDHQAAEARPGPPSLIAYDLASSRPVASLVLKGVTYGSWGDQSWNPGFALSPDGRQIAVYDDRKNALTLVDALRMKVLQTESLTRSQSVVDRLAEWLGIEPTDAWAKGEEYGADLQMRFSPDGRMLYVTGNENLPHVLAATPGPVGIRAIDVARHEITGEALTRSPLAWVQPAPDGSALYALSLFGDDLEPFAAIVRLDPRTLQIQGQQVVTLHDGHPRYYLLAASAR